MRSSTPLLLVALVQLIAGCSEWRGPGSRPATTVELDHCHLARTGSHSRLAAECGVVAVPEDRARPNGRTLGLRVAIVRAASPEPQPDPVFFLAGGPGMAATETFVDFQASMGHVRDRDVVLVDQRGTGGSGALRCPVPATMQGLGRIGAGIARSWATDCLATLDADPTKYTTAIAMQDLDAVRAALGYERINLYGISYGTRAALTYVRDFGHRVRSAVLDGVAPPAIPLGAETGAHAQQALDATVARCLRDTRCAAAFPSLRHDLDAIFASVQMAGARVTLPQPRTGAMTSEMITADVLAWTIRLLLYQPETSALVPLLVHDAVERDDLSRLAAQALLIADDLETGISNAMNISVLCAEDAPFFPARETAAASGAVERYNRERDAIEAICAVWPRAEIPATFRTPVHSDLPVLLLSGEIDPVTPPRYARYAAETLSRSRHLVVPEHGHGMAVRGCLPRLIGEFFDAGFADRLDASCIDELKPLGFFLDFAGPAP